VIPIPDSEPLLQTQRWIANVVIGLNLCPFAQRVFHGNQIRYVVTETTDQEDLLQLLTSEVKSLAERTDPHIETTIIIHPKVLTNFLDYVDFLTLADNQLRRFGHQGTIQLASFHPQYQFEDTEPDAVENYTNRSPYPMLHLLREESITKVSTDPKQMAEIPRRNKRTMKEMGLEAMRALQVGVPPLGGERLQAPTQTA
jgi:hypothetical protein